MDFSSVSVYDFSTYAKRVGMGVSMSMIRSMSMSIGIS